MANPKFDLGDYVDVEARMRWFFSTYPQGSLQSSVTHLSETFVIVQAVAYREPGDLAPGIGHAYEPIPGHTPYTKDSEVMNAETSAWGRALAAIGAPTAGKVASANEVKGRAPSPKPKPSPEPSPEPSPAEPEATSAPSPKKCEHPKYEPVPGKEGMERCVRCGTARKVDATVLPFTERANPWEKS